MAKSTVKKPEKKVIAKVEGKGFHRVEVDAEEFVNWPPPTQDLKDQVEEQDSYIHALETEVKYHRNEPTTQTVDIPTPSDFLTSKGFSQVHQGQRISATFEEIQELLKEYRAL